MVEEYLGSGMVNLWQPAGAFSRWSGRIWRSFPAAAELGREAEHLAANPFCGPHPLIAALRLGRARIGQLEILEELSQLLAPWLSL